MFVFPSLISSKRGAYLKKKRFIIGIGRVQTAAAARVQIADADARELTERRIVAEAVLFQEELGAVRERREAAIRRLGRNRRIALGRSGRFIGIDRVHVFDEELESRSGWSLRGHVVRVELRAEWCAGRRRRHGLLLLFDELLFGEFLLLMVFFVLFGELEQLLFVHVPVIATARRGG